MPGKMIDITAPDGGTFQGFLATPESGSGAGVIVLQEIFGINYFMRETCHRLAAQGYMALCPDLFWRQEPGIELSDMTEGEWGRAFALYQGFDMGQGVADAGAALEQLRGTDGCSGKVGAVGYCLGGMLAHTHRVVTGQGQYVDVSCQQAVAKTLAHAPQIWDIEGAILKRMGVYRQTSGENRVRINWPCKDGYVNYMVQGGTVAYSTRALLGWMKEDGFETDELDAVDWEDMGYGAITPEFMAQLGKPLGEFFNGHTRAELVQGSLDRRILLFPVATPAALQDHPQLEARGYFKELDHPELGVAVQYPGAFVKSGDGGDISGLYRRPPLIGEHNVEIYQEELGLSASELDSLKRGGVI